MTEEKVLRRVLGHRPAGIALSTESLSILTCVSNPLRPVRVECRKWPDDPHWEFDGYRLGVDGHGTWIGITRGTLLASPTRAFHAAADHVTLVPHDAWWLGTFYGTDARRPFDTYVDIATPAVWHGEDLVRAVDLDLDVIRGTTGRIWVDDEDEFAEHRVTLDYPQEVVDRALASSQRVLDDLTRGVAPFDGTPARWLASLSGSADTPQSAP